MSACGIRLSASFPCSGYRAIPVLAPRSIRLPSIVSDSDMTSVTFLAATWAPPSVCSGKSTANSSLPQSRHHVGSALERAPEPGSYLAEEQIPNGMTKRVIDILEAIQIDGQNCKAPVGSPRRAHRLPQPVHEKASGRAE